MAVVNTEIDAINNGSLLSCWPSGDIGVARSMNLLVVGRN